MIVRERLEQDGGDEAHHEGARADADREREHAGDREERRAAEAAHGVAEAAADAVHDVLPALHGVDGFVHFLDVTPCLVHCVRIAELA